MPRSRLRSFITLASAGLLAAAAPAHANSSGSDTTSVTISGGSLAYTTPLQAQNFPAVTLSGQSQIVTAAVQPYTVTDSRGGSAGWNLTVEATQFSDGAGHTLPAGSLSMALPPLPTTDPLANPLALPPTVATALNPIDGSTAQRIASAAAQPLAGAGAWTFTPLSGLRLTVPAAATPGTYTSTVITTLATGP